MRHVSYTQSYWYNFDTVLYQFPETGTSDRCLIGLKQLPRFSGFSLYPAFHFSFTVPLRNDKNDKNKNINNNS